MGYQRRKPTFDPTKPFAWSYSKLKNYESCPRRHLEVDILRNFDDGGEAIAYGNEVHDALANAIGNKGNKEPNNPAPAIKPIPAPHQESLSGWPEKYLYMRAKGALVATEMDLAITNRFTPTGWFDKDVWYRAKVDVAVVSQGGTGKVGIAADWKTGKVVEDSPQLQMTALTMFAHFPTLDAIESRFVWLKSDDESVERVKRADAVRVWNNIAPRVRPLQAAYANPDTAQGFPAKPGFLCRRWCPVKTCPHHGK
jgi:hypothetical protein